MVLGPPPLPTRFPCWCRAVYSWGGESSKDLGFIEGDLIECLNAGDGSWWTGRLRRNKTVGVFPSNFVEVLPENFRPVNRSISPLTSNNSPSPSNSVQKAKSKPFRKPFEAYAKAPHYTTAKQPEIIRQPTNAPARKDSDSSFRNSVRGKSGHASTPPQAQDHVARAPSPAPSRHAYQRSHSPAPPAASSYHHHHRARASSPAPPLMLEYNQRAPSPAPSRMLEYHQRAPSPAPPIYDRRTPSPAPSFSFKPYRPGAERESPPPPAPPPHRNLLTRGGSNASYDDASRQQGYNTPRAASPIPPSPVGAGFTPSPLREAMDGVIEQLDALGAPRSGSTEPSFDPWSPESFDLVHRRSRNKKQPRPRTAMGLGHQDSGYESYGGDSSRENTVHDGFKDEQPLPQLENYVERMETRLRKMHEHSSTLTTDHGMDPPPLPLKNHQISRPKSSMGDSPHKERSLRKQKSSYEIGRLIGRTATTKTNSTNASSGNRSSVTTTSTNTQSTHRSLMSGISASAISSTSAGSLARKNRARSALDFRDGDEDWDPNRPTTPFTGVSYHPSHSTSAMRPQSQMGFIEEGIASVGGLVQPVDVKPKKANFIKRILEATKTGVASGRSSIATGTASLHSSPTKRSGPDGITAIAGGLSTTNLIRSSTARDMGLDSGVDWVQVRRDVNRSNTLSKNERNERRDRCQMMDYPAIDPVDEFCESVEGDEGADGHPVREPINYQALSLGQVDKNSRFVSNLPSMTTSVTLATTYVCRPYRSDVQRLRAIFTWVAEQVHWEEDFESEVDTRRVIQTKRACAEEYAVLIVRGYLKTPGEVPETNFMPRPNHWWNAVLMDDEWRIIDCCLASPSNPRRGLYSNAGSGTAEFWWFLTRPTEICWTHIPEHHAQQHICPPVAHETLLNLPGTCPPYFKNAVAMDLEMLHIRFNVPEDVEVAAEVEVRAFTRDSDGDFFESGDVVKKRALAQAEWYGGVKRYTVKALLPGDEGTGVLKDITHPLAFALPIIHTGENPPYDFVTRHPTPHAQRHDIYVVQPQCQRLALNNTFVFAIRQHPSSMGNGPSSNPGGASPIPFARPTSAMSMTSSAAASAPSSATGSIAGKKPAKLAIQTPDRRGGIGVGGRHFSGEDECSERGVWRGLVLADRTARWCVFAEWVCVG
ncbi:hypothetical protein F4808DRAFT_448364 [Astrocystis sublimbata]|nr:hypothetical protein F4808DRAFT_448364 [Astrocystis sublimbata]